MKNQLSAYEVGYVVKEIQYLTEGKIARVYQPRFNMVVLQIHVPNKGKQFLTTYLPGFLYLSEGKEDSPLKQFRFCGLLRKHIENNRIVSIEQKGFERVVEITLASQDKERKLIVELFGKGNVILCETDYTIIGLIEVLESKDRVLQAGGKYEFPKQDLDLGKLDDITTAINISTQDNIAKTLAVNLGLGRNLAEEICMVCGFDPKKKIPKLGIIKVYEAIQEVMKRKADPRVLYDKEIEDVIPNGFKVYEKKNQHKVKTFSEGIDRVVGIYLLQKEQGGKENEYEKQMKKMLKLVENQKRQLQGIEDEVKINADKAEALYLNYQVVDHILKEINSLQEEMSWDGIKEKFENHAVVKEIDAKEKKVLLEI